MADAVLDYSYDVRLVRSELIISLLFLGVSASAQASDLADALKYAKKVLGEKVTHEYRKYVDGKPDEALAIILESDRTSSQKVTSNRRTPPPAFAKLGKIRLAYPKLLPIIESAAQESGLPPELIDAVIRTESGYRPQAVSRAGAMGLMQLMPKTAKSLGVTNPMDPAQNVSGGARYLRKMIDRFGRVSHALAAYNAGPGAVRKYKGVPPYKETQRYVQVVWQRYQMRLQRNRGRLIEDRASTPEPARPSEDEPLRPTSYE